MSPKMVTGLLFVIFLLVCLLFVFFSGYLPAPNPGPAPQPNSPVVTPAVTQAVTRETGVVTNLQDSPLNPGKSLITVNSAVQQTNVTGFKQRPGHCILTVHVSITNNQATPLVLSGDDIYILMDQGEAYEHGGNQLAPGIAQNYLRFPLTIAPYETKNGPIVFIVYCGSRVNLLTVTGNNSLNQSMVDLNEYIIYA
jgi:hypothetical protein